MKKFESMMLSAIIITLIVSFAQIAVAIHDKNTGILPDSDLKYEVYLQTVVRDTQGQLLSVSETTIGWIVISSFPDGVQIPDLMDYVIDNNVLAEKKIINIDNAKYEKIQFQTERIVDRNLLSNSNPAPNWNDDGMTGMTTGGLYKICGDFKEDYGYQCISLLEARTPQIHIAEGDVITNQWTILRIMN